MRTMTLLAIATALSAALTSGCAGGDRDGGALTVTGSVADERVVLAVPALSPEPTGTAGAGWARVESVPVREGDTVAAGDVVAVLEAGPAEAALAEARAALAEAEARRAVLGERLEDVREARSGIEEDREQLRDTLAGLRRQRTEADEMLEQAREMAEGMRSAPPGASPGAPPGSGQDPREAVERLEAALARLDEGIARAEDGLRRLEDASADLADARSALQSAEDAADAGIAAAEAGVALAEVRLGLATVRSPGPAVVVEAPVLGSVMAQGAPLATLRPEGPAEVVTYLTAEQARGVAEGDAAVVRADSLPERAFEASVERIGSDYAYVPTRFATREIHLLRGFEVRLRLAGGDRLPPGTPVDLTIPTKVSGREAP